MAQLTSLRSVKNSNASSLPFLSSLVLCARCSAAVRNVLLLPPVPLGTGFVAGREGTTFVAFVFVAFFLATSSSEKSAGSGESSRREARDDVREIAGLGELCESETTKSSSSDA